MPWWALTGGMAAGMALLVGLWGLRPAPVEGDRPPSVARAVPSGLPPFDQATSPPDVLPLPPVDAEQPLPFMPQTATIALHPPGSERALGPVSWPPLPPSTVTLKAVGDMIPGTDYPGDRLPADPTLLFRGVQQYLGEVDIVFGNFEGTLTTQPDSAKDISRGMTFAFRTPPAFAAVIQQAGFNVLSVANNHSWDFFEAGFEDTIAHIQQAGMYAVGRKDEIVLVPVRDQTLAFIGFSYLDEHNTLHDLAAATALVQRANAQADVVIISVHAGAEGTDALVVRDQTEYFFSENRGNLVQFSRAMIDAGADLILGHGPHVPRALELYGDRLIVYSLGNFLGYRTLSTVGPLGASMILQVQLTTQGEFVNGRIIPAALDLDGVPTIDQTFRTVSLVRALTQQSFPETPLIIDEDGFIWHRDRPPEVRQP
ncbi:MAG: CapA family protein [Leptolyngbyaceae cyanobacterium T60_A2020_046]|nr:CapA family protein [Leptolyngbyaceae cyanobacterium T60_A2020_046]